MQQTNLIKLITRHAPPELSRNVPAYQRHLWLKTHWRATLLRFRRKALLGNEPLRRKLHHKELWYRGILDEVRWWEEWFATDEGSKWKDEVQDPQRQLQDHLITDRVRGTSSDSLAILDVGAGPVTKIGYAYPGKRVHIVAVDPLANEYKRLLKEEGVTPPIQTRSCEGERLQEVFEPQSFDIAYANNSLDHSYDPLLVIRNMLSLVKKKRFVLLRHYKNEGRIGSYRGLHQWNFDIRRQDLIVWNEDSEQNISRILRHEAQVECYYERSTDYDVFDHTDWVVSVIEKL